MSASGHVPTPHGITGAPHFSENREPKNVPLTTDLVHNARDTIPVRQNDPLTTDLVHNARDLFYCEHELRAATLPA